MKNLWFYHNDEGWFFTFESGPVWGPYATQAEAIEQAFMYLLND